MSHVVNINGSITDCCISMMELAVNVLKADPEITLEIYIDSAGGDPDVAKRIYDLLAEYRNRITTFAGQKCMSSAVLIFLSGDTRIARTDTVFMIHPTSWTLWGMFDFLKSYRSLNGGDLTLTLAEVYTLQAQLNKALNRLTDIEDYTDAIYVERAKLTKEQLHDRRFINTDKEFTSAESLQYGISTKIL